jgi:hypothetical protein
METPIAALLAAGVSQEGALALPQDRSDGFGVDRARACAVDLPGDHHISLRSTQDWSLEKEVNSHDATHPNPHRSISQVALPSSLSGGEPRLRVIADGERDISI